jgi:hypothetical protein
MIERKILIGLITQTEFLRQIESEWDFDYIESTTAKQLSMWCWEYFKKYRKAPLRNIEIIYIEKLKNGINKSLAKEIEEEILPELSNEYENQEISTEYLLNIARDYFKERSLVLHTQELNYLINKNKIDEAIKTAQSFRLKQKETDENEVDLSNPVVISKIESAFDSTYQNVISFPGALGEFWNEQLVRGGLVGILAPEKRGKTYLLLEFMMRAYRQNRKVALFQAGDMTENQQLMRICIYLAGKSNLEKYCGIQYIPVQDCVKNQCDTCEKSIRECDFGLDLNIPEDKIRKEITKKQLVEEYKNNKKYKPCYNCVEWTRNRWGTVWLKEVEIKIPLSLRLAKLKIQKFFIDKKKNIKISTHVNGTLTLSKIKAILKKWEENEGFIPDAILVDYGDLLESETRMEERAKQNYIWRGLRALSQEKNSLVIVPTQSDAAAYSKNRLDLENFSEDKRKYAHVTAMYGLNQDVSGREKELGIMRINRIVVREGDFHPSQEVIVLQRLQIGRPFLGSFY